MKFGSFVVCPTPFSRFVILIHTEITVVTRRSFVIGDFDNVSDAFKAAEGLEALSNNGSWNTLQSALETLTDKDNASNISDCILCSHLQPENK